MFTQRKEGVVSVTAVVLTQPCPGDVVFLGESKSTLFGLPKVDAFRITITYNRTAQPRCYHNAFYGRPLREP